MRVCKHTYTHTHTRTRLLHVHSCSCTIILTDTHTYIVMSNANWDLKPETLCSVAWLMGIYIVTGPCLILAVTGNCKPLFHVIMQCLIWHQSWLAAHPIGLHPELIFIYIACCNIYIYILHAVIYICIYRLTIQNTWSWCMTSAETTRHTFPQFNRY